jgi:phosphatidate cytidylyltransferase
MNNLVLRSLTGLVFISSIIFPVLFSKEAAVGVFSLYFVLGIIEFYRLFKSGERFQINWETSTIFACIIYGLSVGAALGWVPIWMLMIIPCAVFILFLLELWRKTKQPLNNMAINIFGIVYLVIPFTFMAILSNNPNNGFPLVLGMFILIWINDSFAYLSGRYMGKHKMFERVSPKKTWEGTLGGFLFTIIGGILIAYFTEQEFIFWIISAIIISPLSIVGDLLESLMKRDLNIKDSGNILPGHGGILDRFDATIFVSPFYFFWIFIYSFVL